jgi:serine/threonine-protein kinase
MECPSCHAQIDPGKFCPACGASLAGAAPAEPVDPLLGKTLGNKYRVVKLLGEGGMGAVYMGDQQLGTKTRHVAIKTLHPHLSKDPKVLARFEREVGTVAELEHPNTIQVYDFGKTDDGILYIVMEFIQGMNLADLLEKNGAMEPARVEKILNQICGSLEEAHGRGIVHRDLKPDNIVLTERAGQKDFVKVLDFGIAKRSGEADQNEQKLTQQGMVLGTPPYMSPEQFTGKPIDARSDIYSLAIMAYEMLTGELPFRANTAWEWATQHMTQPPRDIDATAVSARVPQRMKDAVKKGLAKNPEERFPTVRAFFDAFSAGAPAVATAAAPPGQPAMGAAPQMAQALPGKGKTEIATPLDFGGGGPMSGGGYGPPPPMPQTQGAPMGNAPAPAHFGTPAGGNVAFPTPNAGIPQPPPREHGGGGNKGLLLGAAAVIGVLSIGAIVFALKGSSNKGDGLSLPGSATAAPTQVDLTPSATPSSSAATPPGGGSVIPLAPPGPTPSPTPHPVHHGDAGAKPAPTGSPSSSGGGASSGGGTPSGGEPIECVKARAMRAAGNIAAYQVLAKECEAKGGHV